MKMISQINLHFFDDWQGRVSFLCLLATGSYFVSYVFKQLACSLTGVLDFLLLVCMSTSLIKDMNPF